MERLQKILARGGIASRRAAEALVTSGRVRVNGRVVTELGTKADPRKDKIEVDGKRVVAELPAYVVLHKPRGIVSTMSDPEGRPTVRELLDAVGARVFPVGRLDFATSGVLLATNDGEFADGLLHPRKAVPKTYVVKVKGEMREDDLDRWRKGVRLEDGMTLPAEVHLLRHEEGKTWFTLTIKEGRNQQIRRMGEATRFPVMRLARVAFAGINVEGLRPGQWRLLSRDELVALKKDYGVPRSIPSQARLAAEHGRAPKQGSDVDAHGRSTERGAGPRYGGGSPGRRSYDVTEDWGGGAGRGSSSGRYGNDRSDSRSDTRSDDRGHRGPSRGSRSGGSGPSRSGGSRSSRSSGPSRDSGPRDSGSRDSGGFSSRGDIGREGSGGRNGRTRTTGTSGGIGSRTDADRVKGRRGR